MLIFNAICNSNGPKGSNRHHWNPSVLVESRRASSEPGEDRTDLRWCCGSPAPSGRRPAGRWTTWRRTGRSESVPQRSWASWRPAGTCPSPTWRPSSTTVRWIKVSLSGEQPVDPKLTSRVPFSHEPSLSELSSFNNASYLREAVRKVNFINLCTHFLLKISWRWVRASSQEEHDVATRYGAQIQKRKDEGKHNVHWWPWD